MIETKQHSLDRFAHWTLLLGLSVFGFFSPQSIAGAQIGIGIFFASCLLLPDLRIGYMHSLRANPVLQSVFLFLLWSAFSAFVGVDLGVALRETGKSLIWANFAVLICALIQSDKFKFSFLPFVLVPMAIGEILSSADFISRNLFNYDLGVSTPGPVTHSGQLVYSLPLFIAYLAIQKDRIIPKFRPIVLTGIIFGILALLVNLKRGPWLACFFQVLLFAMYSKNKKLAYSLFASPLLLVVPSIYNRILHSTSDFLSSGGRSDMWLIGVDTISRFPMGIGFANSRYIRELHPFLPIGHRHLHNNLLNIALETGWTGLVLFFIFLFSVLSCCMTSVKELKNTYPRNNALLYLTVASGLAIFGSQVAGIIEYNFGDGEIRLLLWLCVGIIASNISKRSNSCTH